MSGPFSYTDSLQIGKGSLYLLTDETMCEETTYGRINLKIYIHGFKIAHVDAYGKIIDKNIMAFDGAECTSAAQELANALYSVSKNRQAVASKDRKIRVEPIENEGVRIVHGDYSITIQNDEIIELELKMLMIIGLPYRSHGECP
jgi:hypothetical protein